MSTYNLDEVPEHFLFTLKGNEYRMVYPTTEQISEVQKLDEDTTLSAKAKTEKQTKYLNSLVEPVKEGDPSLEDALKNVSVKVLQKFSEMLKAELSIE